MSEPNIKQFAIGGRCMFRKSGIHCPDNATDHVRFHDRPNSCVLSCSAHKALWISDSRMWDFHPLVNACCFPQSEAPHRWIFSKETLGDGRCEIEWGDGLERLVESQELVMS